MALDDEELPPDYHAKLAADDASEAADAQELRDLDASLEPYTQAAAYAPVPAPEGGDYGGVATPPALAPAPAPAPAPGATPAAPGAGWTQVDTANQPTEKSAAAPIPASWEQVDTGFPAEPEKPDTAYGSNFVGGVYRGGAHELQNFGNLLGTAFRKSGQWTDQQWMENTAAWIDATGKGVAEQADKAYPLGTMTMQDAIAKGVLGPWLSAKAGEQVLPMSALIAMSKIPIVGVPAVITYGALVGADRAGRQPDATWASIGAGAGEGAAMMAAPLKLMQAAHGLPVMQRLMANVAGMTGIGAAGTATAPIPEAVRTGTYTPPTAGQVAEGAVVGGIAGVPGVLGGRKPPEPPPPVVKPPPVGAPAEKPPAASGDPAVAAATSQAVNGPTPVPGEAPVTIPGMSATMNVPGVPGGAPGGAPGGVPGAEFRTVEEGNIPTATRAAVEQALPPVPPFEPPLPETRAPLQTGAHIDTLPVEANAPAPPGRGLATEGAAAPVAEPVPAASAAVPPVAPAAQRQMIPLNNLPDYVREGLTRTWDEAHRLGVVDDIERLSAEGKTALQVANELGSRLDPVRDSPTGLTVRDFVRSVRAGLGVPSMEERAGFDAWAKNYRERQAGGGEPAAPTAPPATPRAEPAAEARPTRATVGDYVQWSPGGVYQFTEPRRVRAVHGDYALVEGSDTGLPLGELTVARPTEAPPREAAPAAAAPTEAAPRFTTEPDHLDATRSVAKDAVGEVVGKGATAEAAMADAQARGGQVYPAEAPVAAAAAAAAPVAEAATTVVEPPAAPAPAAPKRSTRARAKGAELTPAAEAVVDAGAAKAAVEQAAAPEPKAATGEARATPTVVGLVKRGMAAKRQTERERMQPPPLQERAETPQQRAARIKREVEADVAEAGREPATATPIARGTENVGERVTKQRVEEATEAPTETRAPVQTRAAAEGREPDPDLRSDTMAASTPGKEAHASHLLHDMLEHPAKMTPELAHERYGVKEPGTRGQGRKFATFGDYLAERIRIARDPKSMGRLVAEGQKIEASRGPIAQKNAKLAELSDRIDRLFKEQANLDAMEKAHRALPKTEKAATAADKNAAALDEMRSALGDDLRMEDTDRARLGINAFDTPGSALNRLMKRASVNAKIRARLRESTATGKVYDLHDYLDDIIGQRAVKTFTPWLHKLAVRYKQMVPRGLSVMSYETAQQRYPGRAGFEAGQPRNNRGVYALNENIIVLNPEPHARISHIETLLHEATHPVTFHYLKDIGNRLDTGAQVTDQEARHYNAMMAIDGELRNIRGVHDFAPEMFDLSPDEARWLDYSLSREHAFELVTIAMTNPHMQELMSRVDASPKLRDRLTELGMAPDPTKKSMWETVKSSLRYMLGLDQAYGDSLLDWALRPLTETINVGAGALRQGMARGRIPTAKDPLPMRYESDGLSLPEVGRALDADRAAERTVTRQTRERLTDAQPDPAARELLRPFGDRVLALNFGSRTSDAGKALERAMREGSGVRLGVARTLRAVGLPGMTTSEIARYYKNELPQGARIRDARAAMQAATQKIYDQYGDRVGGWIKQLNAAGKDFGAFINDVTTAQASVGRPDFDRANAHLSGPALDRARELQTRFETFPADKQDLYRNLRDFYQEVGWAERQAAYEYAVELGLKRGETPATDTEIAEMARIARSKPQLDRFMADPDASPLAGMMAERWQNSRSMVKEILDLRRRGWINGDYFPLRRHGDWIVRVGDPERAADDPNYAVRFFESARQAEAWRLEMRSVSAQEIAKGGEGFDVSPVRVKQSTATAGDAFRGVVPDRMIAQFDQAVARRGLTGPDKAAALDALNSTLMHYLTQGQGTRFENQLKRRGVEGASEDQAKTLATEFLTFGSRMGFLRHGAEESAAYGEAERHVQRLGRGDSSSVQNSAAAALQELQARRAPVDGDESTRWMGKVARGFTTGSFLYHLVRPAQMLYNAIDAQSRAQVFLGAEFGHGRAAAAMARANRQVGPAGFSTGLSSAAKALHGALKQSDWHISRMFEQQLGSRMPAKEAAALIEAANQRGLIDVSQVRELQRMAGNGAFGFGGGGSGAFDVGHNMMNLFAVGNHVTDATNRVAILKAGYDLGMRAYGGDSARAIAKAVDLAERAMPNYSYWNKPRVATERSPLAKGNPFIALPLQYKIFGLTHYSTMASVVKEAMARGPEGAVARNALAGMFVMNSLLVGVTANAFGVPVDLATGLWDWINGKPGPHNYQNDVRHWMTKTMGAQASDFFSRGALGSLGLDASRSLKLANPLGVQGPKTYDKPGMQAALATALLGPSGELGEQFISGFGHLFNGEIHKGVIELMPRMASDAIKTYDLATKGLTDARGVPIIKPGDITTQTLIEKAVGVNPMQIAKTQDRREAERQVISEVDKARRVALEHYVNNKDASWIRAFNANKSVNEGFLIKSEDMERARARRREQTKAPLGMAVPKRLLPAAREAARF